MKQIILRCFWLLLNTNLIASPRYSSEKFAIKVTKNVHFHVLCTCHITTNTCDICITLEKFCNQNDILLGLFLSQPTERFYNIGQ